MKNEAEINFFKRSGKWYEGGKVDMGDVEPWHDTEEVVKQIRKAQKILIDGFRGYTVVLSDTAENDKDPNYNKTWLRLISAEKMDLTLP